MALLSLMLSLTCIQYSVDNRQKCPQIVIGFTIVGSGISHCAIHRGDKPLVTFQRCGSDVTCFDATSHPASFTPRCWSEMSDFMSNAFRFCRCVVSLQGLWHSWVNCTFEVTSSSVQQCLFVQRSAGQSLHSSIRLHIRGFVPHIGARNSHNSFRMSSTDEELS